MVSILSVLALGSARDQSLLAQQFNPNPPSSTAQQIEELQRQLDQLRLETSQNQSQPSTLFAGYPTQGGLPIADKITAPLAMTSATKPAEKKFPEMKMTGFFQLDAAKFDQSPESIATLGDIQDGAGFRRARLAATGNLSEQVSINMEFDFAQAQARFVDVWGQVKNTPFGNVRIGRFRQPFGMSELTGIRELAFLERPTSVAFAPFRQTGIMFSDNALDERATWAVAGFRTLSDNFGNVFGDDGGYGTAERFTYLVRDSSDDSGLVHVGASHSFLDPARNQFQIASLDEVFVGQQPNLGPAGLGVLPLVGVPPFVNSGIFNLDHANLFGLEAAASVGHALVQAEYRWANLSLPTGEEVTVQTGYATARYVLTGETIPYNQVTGVFGRIKPKNSVDFAKGEIGAWEVVARIGNINLNPLFGQPSVTGNARRLNSLDLGLNWYMTANSKFQLNWINGDLNDPVLGDSMTNTYAARVQFDF